MLPAWCFPGTTQKTEGFCRKVVSSHAGFQNPKNLPQDRELCQERPMYKRDKVVVNWVSPSHKQSHKDCVSILC